MTIHSSITEADYLAFSKNVVRTTRRSGGRVKFFLMAMALGAVTGFLVPRLSIFFHAPSFAIGVLIGMFWLLWVLRMQSAKMRPQNDGIILGQLELILENEGLRHRSARHESFFQWQAVRRIDETKNHIFIMVDRVAGIIVPRRSFASSTEQQQFLAELKRHSLPPASRP